MDLFAALDSVLLSVQISVSTWGKPRPARIFWKMHALRAAMKRAAYSASAAEGRAFGRNFEMDSNPPLIWSFPLVCFLPRK
jgi:hypothetical protein